VKVSVATPLNHSKGGQFVAHVKALPGNPYDGHTLATVIPEMEQQIGVTLNRILADAGYRGHNAPPEYRFKVYTAGQKRRMTEHIRRQLRRRSAAEPAIGHLKDDHRMDRNHLAHRLGDANNAVLAAVGYNFRRLLAWLSAARRPVYLGPIGPADLSYQSWLIGLLQFRLPTIKPFAKRPNINPLEVRKIVGN
jgi:transposase, IS5 family